MEPAARLLLGLLAVAGTIRSAEPARAAIFVPIVFVVPDGGAPGEPVQLTVFDFTPDATLAADFFSAATGVVPLGTFQADADGMATFDTAVPATAQPGTAAFGVRNVANLDERPARPSR